MPMFIHAPALPAMVSVVAVPPSSIPPLCRVIVFTEAAGLEGKTGSCKVVEALGITTLLVSLGIIPPAQLFRSFQSELGVPCQRKVGASVLDKPHR